MTKTMKKRKIEKPRFRVVLGVGLGFLIVAVLLLVESRGIISGNTGFSESMLTKSQLESMQTDKPVSEEKTCLFIWNSKEAASSDDAPTFRQMLRDMRVPVLEMDVAKEKIPGDLSGFRTIVIGVANLDALGSRIFDICDYAEAGGRVMLPLTLEKNNTFNAISSRFGVNGSGNDFKTVHGFRMSDGFMIGADGRSFKIDDSYQSALNVGLDDQCKVYMRDSQERTPLIWERSYGKGKFVVCNFGYCGKSYRGFYSSAYSLLEDISVWPVINASSFYLDDFPSPMPQGDVSYIRKDYSMNTSSFYTDVWWPDIIQLSKKYGIHYTGLLIETYSNQVSGRLKQNMDTGDYYYFGNMLLNMGGELGYHGYNHQPLCGPGFRYKENLGYRLWDSKKEMRYAMQELYRFSTGLFPDTTFQVYVPPSNILSDEARTMIGNGDMKGIRTIASTYLPGGSVYEQEFEIAEDGITETPRVISGAVFDNYTWLTAISELNLHFVNSHFMHPDDLMDPDRGAKLGWNELKKRLTRYLDNLTESAPQLEMTTGTQMAGRVQRFSCISVKKRVSTAGKETIYFSGLADEAWCLMRFNSGTPGKVSGGSIEHITGSLYLLHVTGEKVTIQTR